MITVIDTIRAVSALVEDLFGEPPTTKDVTEGFTRPCTYVQPTLLDTAVEGGLRHDSFTVEIIRFAQRSRKGYLELLAYQEQLTEALENPIPVEEEFLLYPEDVSFSLRREEMTLVATFSVENFQLLPDGEADAETMELLNWNGKE